MLREGPCGSGVPGPAQAQGMHKFDRAHGKLISVQHALQQPELGENNLGGAGSVILVTILVMIYHSGKFGMLPAC